MDLIILLSLIVITIIVFKKFNNVIFLICIIDIFLRLVYKIDSIINLKEVSTIIYKYLPTSILSIINEYSTGIINQLLVWLYIGIYLVFLFLLIKIFFKKKK
jgi:hypothetical protein